jgi:thiamine biosynthesis protein ThiI
MFDRVVLVHYHEIGLKGNNRSSFENRLRLNIDSAVAGLTQRRAQRVSSRLFVPVTDDSLAERLLDRVAGIPGVSYVADALVTARDMDDIGRAALLVIDSAPAGPFAVDARRSNTDFPVSSNGINVAIGGLVRERTGRSVDLKHPAAVVRVEVVQGSAFVYARRVEGAGGLPVGTSGKVVALISAGIDSPVAAWRLMKRGAVVIGVHFSGQPHTNDASARLAVEIGHVLERHEGLARLYVVPFGEIQRRVALDTPPALRVLLYRRLMLRVAEALAHTEHARALVTGESLGQVASQTLENMAAVDAAAGLPVLRPLVGMDKNEIIAEARKLGTYDYSSQRSEDCCTLFMPRMPATRAQIEDVDAAEQWLDVDSIVKEAVAAAEYSDFRCPAYRPPRPRPHPEGKATA